MDHIDIQCAVLDAADTLTAMRMLAVSKQLYAARKYAVEQRILNDKKCYLEDLGFTVIYCYHTTLNAPGRRTASVIMSNGCLVAQPLCGIMDITKIPIIAAIVCHQYKWYVRKNDVTNVALLEEFKRDDPSTLYIKVNRHQLSSLLNFNQCYDSIFGNISVAATPVDGFFLYKKYQMIIKNLTLKEYQTGHHAAFVR